MKLLVVDDEPHVREMMRLSLESAGYAIDEADSGEAAIDRFGDGRAYAAVLLDQKMPGLDGMETMKRLLAVAPDARVVMVTAFASVELAVDAMRLGAAHFLRKPMTPETLRGAVAAALADSKEMVHAGRARAPRTTTASIERITLNGFRIEPVAGSAAGNTNEHAYVVTRFADATSQTVTVVVDPQVVARVGRLTRRELPPSSRFWRWQAERLLIGHLWTEGRFPVDGRLTLHDLSRDDVDVAAAWGGD